MCSKLQLLVTTTVLGLALLGSSTGCNFHFRENPDNETSLSLSPADSGCMLGASSVISDYFDGKTSPEKISAVWDCTSKSLKLFAERTRGTEKGVFKPEELRNFMEEYFLNKQGEPRRMTITDGLMEEFMQLKATLLGGSTQRLTLEELERLRSLIVVLKEQSLLLQPYIPMSAKWAETQSAETIDDAVRALERAGQSLAQPLQRTGKAYAFERFRALKEAFEATVGAPIKRGPFAIVVERMPLIEAFKSVLVSPPKHEIAGKEWIDFLTATARCYGLFLRYVHLNANFKDFTFGEGRERFVQLTVDFINILDDSVSRHDPANDADFAIGKEEDKQRAITFEEIDAIIDAIYDAELPIPAKAKDNLPAIRESLKDLFKPLIRRMVGGPDTGFTGRKAPGLTHGPLRRLADFFVHWSYGQSYIEAIFHRLGDPTQEYTAEQIKQVYDPQSLFQGTDMSPLLVDAAGRLQNIINTTPAILLPGQNRVFIDSQTKTRPLSFAFLTKINLANELSRILIEGYADEPKRAEEELGLTFDEVMHFFNDFFPLGRDLRIFDPFRDNRQMIGLRFLEGNNFTFASNGGSLLDVPEASQLLIFLYSVYERAGLTHQSLISTLEKQNPNCIYPKLDAVKEKMIRPECFRKEYFENRAAHWADTPDFIKFYDALPDGVDVEESNQFSFRVYLETASRLRGYSETPVTSADMLGFSGVIYYVEALIQRFDENKDGAIDQNEADKAFPIFHDTLKSLVESRKMSDAVPEGKLRALFTYLLNYGKIPSGFWEKLKWLEWSWHDSWEFKANRLSLIKLFALISADSSKSPNAMRKDHFIKGKSNAPRPVKMHAH